MEKKNKSSKKGLFIVGGIILLLIIALLAPTDKDSSTESSQVITELKYISGLSPTDVYLNMEKQGFKTEKLLSKEYGNMWTNKKTIDGMDYTVQTYSSNINSVESVRATAMIDVINKDIVATQQFFMFISSLPYEGSEPQNAMDWVKDNFNNDKATITIGDVMFTISAPTKQARMLLMEKSTN